MAKGIIIDSASRMPAQMNPDNNRSTQVSDTEIDWHRNSTANL